MSVLLDITQIPTQMAGLADVSRVLAVAGLAFLIPFTILEMNVRALQRREFPSYSGLMTRILVVVMCLIAYSGLFGFILKLSQTMSFAILSEADWGNFLTKGLQGSNSTYPTLAVLVKSVTSAQELILFLSSLLTLTVREVIVMLQACFLSLLYAFGPLALVCFVNEKTGQVGRGWLAGTFQVAFWSFFLRLALRVWLTLAPLSAAAGGGMSDYIGILTVNLTFFLLILGTPLLAARLLSGENLAAFATAALGAVETVVVAKQLQIGRFANREIAAYGRSSPKQQRSFLHHPIPASMTRTYEMMFGRRKAPAPPSEGAPR
ncbi:MAG: hypothetical protein KGM24_11885 [Elusimicrobia bacterium]|nr:hypothetical protein [Elusimicrobiota bacterium]